MNDENQNPNPPADAGTTPPPPTDGATPPADGAAQPKIVSPLQSDDEISEDQFITGGDDHSFIASVPVPAHPNTQFDEKKFLELLAKSISLTKTEKQRIIDSIPKLSQYQIDELMRIFEEEQKKFAELNAKHEDQLKEIEAKHKNDWNDIELKAKQDAKKKKDDDEAAALRKKMGLE
ncbi:MAG: hypothetical protein V2A63_04895 [Patescibacteria group bacterium]